MRICQFLKTAVLLGLVACNSGGDYVYQDVTGSLENNDLGAADNVVFEDKAYVEGEEIKAASVKKDQLETVPVLAATQYEAALEPAAASLSEPKLEVVEIRSSPAPTASAKVADPAVTVLVAETADPIPSTRIPSFEEAADEAERRNPEIVLARDNEYFAKNRKAWEGAKLNLVQIQSAGLQPMQEADEVKEEKAPAVTFLAAVIYHGDGQYDVSSEDAKALRETARFFKKNGGDLRVIGHASARTRNMSQVDHKTVNLKISTDRAIKVSQELVRLGIPAGKIYVGAVADNELAGPENMPVNEAQNRRTEIYIAY